MKIEYPDNLLTKLEALLTVFPQWNWLFCSEPVGSRLDAVLVRSIPGQLTRFDPVKAFRLIQSRRKTKRKHASNENAADINEGMKALARRAVSLPHQRIRRKLIWASDSIWLRVVASVFPKCQWHIWLSLYAHCTEKAWGFRASLVDLWA
eukprot:scaffold249122_cov15-Tisochrysis_lutea.AAC.1